jgi:hypothetical protein
MVADPSQEDVVVPADLSHAILLPPTVTDASQGLAVPISETEQTLSTLRPAGLHRAGTTQTNLLPPRGRCAGVRITTRH